MEISKNQWRSTGGKSTIMNDPKIYIVCNTTLASMCQLEVSCRSSKSSAAQGPNKISNWLLYGPR